MAREGWEDRRTGKGGCEPWSSRTGRGSGGIRARARRCTGPTRVVDGGSLGTGRKCSSLGVFGSRNGWE